MTGIDGRVPSRELTEGPLTLELLADLHAGVFDAQVATQLQLRVAADAQAKAVLAALDATVAELSALPRQRAVRMPDAMASRLDAALTLEAARQRKARWGKARWASIGMLAAAAAAIGIVAVSGVHLETGGTPQADDALGNATRVQSSEPFALTRGNLGGALDHALKERDYGPLTPPQLLQNCLLAHGVTAGAEPLGALEVSLNGKPGVLLVLPTGEIAELRLLVVGPSCRPGNPSQLAEYVVGR